MRHILVYLTETSPQVSFLFFFFFLGGGGGEGIGNGVVTKTIRTSGIYYREKSAFIYFFNDCENQATEILFW